MRGYGGIGRRAGFRFLCRKACGFDPHYPHHKERRDEVAPLFVDFDRRNKGLLGFLESKWYALYEVMLRMETKEILRELRVKNGLSQDRLAEKVYVTRQAVSRWETGETVPNTETLKLLSKLFDVSINTLLGSPRTLICQCCGMPLEDACLSREPDGTYNEDYCQWCYTDGAFAYKSLPDLIDFLVDHMSNEHWSPAQVRGYLEAHLPKLAHWQRRET